jgi:hypothetical protein|tara:strand:+ start:477 stop:590 length:114 start_codon:yes stop_codon:yes gene_type:complete
MEHDIQDDPCDDISENITAWINYLPFNETKDKTNEDG